MRDCVYGQPAVTAISCRGEVEAACRAARRDPDQAALACREAEVAAWRALLDETLPQAIATAAEGDGSGRTAVAPFDASLHVAQAAWRDWAEAECALQAARWGDGGAAAQARAACARRLVAERVIALRVLAEGW